MIEFRHIHHRNCRGISLPDFNLTCARILLADGRNIYRLVEIMLGVRGGGLSRNPICLGYRKRLANLSAINISISLHQIVTTLIDAVITFCLRDIQTTTSIRADRRLRIFEIATFFVCHSSCTDIPAILATTHIVIIIMYMTTTLERKTGAFYLIKEIMMERDGAAVLINI